jgi:hypothetical protein
MAGNLFHESGIAVGRLSGSAAAGKGFPGTKLRMPSNNLNDDVVDALVFLALTQARETLRERLPQGRGSNGEPGDSDALPGICTPAEPKPG